MNALKTASKRTLKKQKTQLVILWEIKLQIKLEVNQTIQNSDAEIPNNRI